jgi:Spy/CpxP family protein refolding chaperone
MKTTGKMLVIGMTTVALCTASVSGRGFAGPGGPGGMGGGRGLLFPALLRALNLTPEQKGQVEQIMKRHRTNLEPVLGQLHATHDELAAKLLAPGPVVASDLSPTVQRIAQLQQQLIQEWAEAALEARAVLTSDQLAKAAQIKQQLDTLRAQTEKLLGAPPPGGPMN